MKTIIADLLDIRGGYLLNQVNCQGAYGSGVAGQISKKWPDVRQAYIDKVKEDGKGWHLLGEILTVPAVTVGQGYQDTNVVHLFAQDTYGSAGIHTNYNAFIAALATFKTFIRDSEGCTYIPYKIGCGLGGGNWDKISKIIEFVIPDAIVCIPSWHADADNYRGLK